MVAMPSQQLLLHEFLGFSSFFLRWIIRKSLCTRWLFLIIVLQKNEEKPRNSWSSMPDWLVPAIHVQKTRILICNHYKTNNLALWQDGLPQCPHLFVNHPLGTNEATTSQCSATTPGLKVCFDRWLHSETHASKPPNMACTTSQSKHTKKPYILWCPATSQVKQWIISKASQGKWTDRPLTFMWRLETRQQSRANHSRGWHKNCLHGAIWMQRRRTRGARFATNLH